MGSAVFDHLAALISIILSLAIANLIAFAATLVHRQRKVILSAPQLLWAAVIFLSQIEFWLSAYSFRQIQYASASVASILFVIFVPVLHYLQAVLVVPDYEPGVPVDLPRHHAENYREYIGAGVLTDLATLAYLSDLLLVHATAAFPGAFFIGGVFAATGVVAMLVRRPWVQVAMPALQLALRIALLPTIAMSLTATG